MKKSNRILNDAYYTDADVAKHCVEKLEELFGSTITQYIEPSAGAGVFLNYLNKPYTAYDIAPNDDRVILQDFLTLNLDYKIGRCAIGNPPFGKSAMLAFKFIKHAIEFCDYVAFILPISQLNNDKFNFCKLVYSEDLGLQKYTNIKLHCCFNIYKKCTNVKEKILEYVSIVYFQRGASNKTYNHMMNNNITPDIRICKFGRSCGKIVDYNEQYCNEFCIFVLYEDRKEEILELIRKIYKSDFLKKSSIATFSLNPAKLHIYLKDNLNNL